MIKIDDKLLSKDTANPFNWTGSKHRYLEEFLNVLPKDIRGLKVLDSFVGGGDLISKLPVDWKITANDFMSQIVELHTAIQERKITKRSILRSYKSRGMSKENSEAYFFLRQEYNENPDPFLLYLLMTNSFNNQLRFNNNGGFNMPFGKDRSSFNKRMQSKLDNYSKSLSERSVKFINEDFRNIDYSQYDLLLIDPPYRNTCATYNESTGWGVEEDLELFKKIDLSGSKFIYFNQTWSKGVPNEDLISWMKKYDSVVLKETSSNCSYNRDNKKTEEVMVFKV